MYPVNVADVCKFLVPSLASGEPFVLAGFGQTDTAGFIEFWNSGELGPQPTEDNVYNALSGITTVGGQTFDQWYVSHGGDELQTLRRKAKEALDNQSAQVEMLIRAVVLETADYISGEIVSNHNDLLTWLGTQTNLINRAQLNNFVPMIPTYGQIRNAIQNRITNGDVDT